MASDSPLTTYNSRLYDIRGYCYMSQPIRAQRSFFRALLLASLLVAPSIGACDFLDVTDQVPLTSDSADYAVLFIGSSYLGYNELTWMFEQLAFSVQRPVFVREQIVYGASLNYHSGTTLTEAAIESYDWDFVVLQGSSYRAGYPELLVDSILPALRVLKSKIDENHSATRIVYMMGWAFEDGIEFEDGSTDTFEEMQQKIYDNTLAWADSLGLIVAPVGWAWQELLQDKTQLHYLHSADYSHPNVRGSYLSACVFVATMFGRSLNTVTYYAGIPDTTAHELQQVASRVVLDNLELWNAAPVGAALWDTSQQF